MRIWYVSHYAVPRECSLGWRSQYIAHALSRAGHEATVWAASRHHWVTRPCGEIPFAYSRDPDGYDFRTIETPPYRGNGLGRLRNILAFSRGMALALADATAAGAAPELIIVSSPHPWVWRPLVRQVGRRIKMIFEERDIWPLSLVDLAGQPPWSPLVLWLGFIVRRIYREADAVISLLPDAEPFLQRQGLPPGRFVWIPNGVDPAVFGLAAGIKAPPRHVDALAAARRDGRLAVIYAGSMGPPNWLESILALAEVEARGNRPYHFFLMGDGVSRKKLEAGAAGLDFITFLPPVRREEAWAVTKEADLGYQSSPDVPIIQYGLSLNKIFDYFMLGKPVLSVVRPGRHPVGLAGAGFEVSPGDPAALDRVLREAASMPRSQLASLGDRGRRYALEHHNWQTLGRQYARVCEMVAAGAPLDDSKPGYAILQWSG